MTDVHPKDMSPEDRDAYHRNAEAKIKTFKYETPVPNGRPKQVTWLVKRPIMHVVVQCVHEGGENNLHYHTKSETTWMVLRGHAEFTGADNKVFASLGPMEGVLIPGGSRYKFGKVGEEDLEILQMVAIEDPDGGDAERINLEAHREWMTSGELTRY